ncbi:MAG: hypothetical protein AAF662_00845 [Pseudomonadota bacterium]
MGQEKGKKRKSENVDKESMPSVSTTALAKRLRLPIEQLFGTLRDYGWIERENEKWTLTGKGSLHGGAYRDSERFGRYIVWPEDLTDHPLLAAIESDQRLSPVGLSRHFNHLSARQVNRHFAEIGLLRMTTAGLELTHLGSHFGGRQERDTDSDLLTVSWPQALIENPIVRRELLRLGGDGLPKSVREARAAHPPHQARKTGEAGGKANDTGLVDDLFAGDTTASNPQRSGRKHTGSAGTETDRGPRRRRRGLDGHEVDSLLQLRVCDWLYGAQLAYAVNRALPCEEPLHADFYVPSVGLYIECWERDVPTDTLSRRLRVREVCRELELAYLEIAAGDLDRVDAVLTARLAELGLRL